MCVLESKANALAWCEVWNLHMLLSFQLWYCVCGNVCLSALNTEIEGCLSVCVCVLVCPVIVSKVIQRSFPSTFHFAILSFSVACVCIYVPIYCVGVEEDREDIFSCQNDSTMHQQWFVSLIRQSEVTSFQPITSISPCCGCISESYCILINSSKSTALFWSKQSPYKISLSVSIDAFMSVHWKKNGAENFHSKLLVNFKETACVTRGVNFV